MSDLVNYNKRDVGLPAHCKDLIDLLRRYSRHAIAPRLEDFEIARDKVLTETLSELEVHFQTFHQFRGMFSELRITEPDDQIAVQFNRTVYSGIELSISIPPGSPHQQAIRSFLKSRSLEWPEDAEFPTTVYPAIPVQIFLGITPLPTDPAELSRLTAEFFLQVGLESRSALLYHHWMIAKRG